MDFNFVPTILCILKEHYAIIRSTCHPGVCHTPTESPWHSVYKWPHVNRHLTPLPSPLISREKGKDFFPRHPICQADCALYLSVINKTGRFGVHMYDPQLFITLHQTITGLKTIFLLGTPFNHSDWGLSRPHVSVSWQKQPSTTGIVLRHWVILAIHVIYHKHRPICFFCNSSNMLITCDVMDHPGSCSIYQSPSSSLLMDEL